MLSLGINSAYHECAAAIVRDGKLVLAVEEERLSGVKHGKLARIDNPDELPWRAIDCCLTAAGVRLAEIDQVGYSLQPGARLAMIGVDRYPLRDPRGWGTTEGELEFDRRIRRIPRALSRRAADPTFAQRVRFFPHHRAHAACAYHTGPFDNAAVLIVDGIGETHTAWLGHARRGELTELEKVAYPHSIGMLWEQLARYLGFTDYDAGKAMGLAAYGDPTRFDSALDRLFRIVDAEGGTVGDTKPPFVVNGDLARFRADLSGWERLFGPRRTTDDELPQTQRFADLAAAMQRRTEQALLALARRLHRQTGEDALLYAGGVALNCLANARLEREGPFSALYVPAAAHDAGTALGVALELDRRATPNRARQATPCAWCGPRFAGEQIDEAIVAAGRRGVNVADVPSVAAELIASGQIVGWFQEGLEFGPRALGNRSLLADPRRLESRMALNGRIKRREAFRPFGAACLAEALTEWFEVPADRPGATVSRELMLLAYQVRPERRRQIPAVVHQDGSCRVQAVEQARQPRFHALLRQLRERTGVPLVLNTSFNDNEPLVCAPEQALATCARSPIDALLLGDRLVVG